MESVYHYIVTAVDGKNVYDEPITLWRVIYGWNGNAHGYTDCYRWQAANDLGKRWVMLQKLPLGPYPQCHPFIGDHANWPYYHMDLPPHKRSRNTMWRTFYIR